MNNDNNIRDHLDYLEDMLGAIDKAGKFIQQMKFF